MGLELSTQQLTARPDGESKPQQSRHLPLLTAGYGFESRPGWRLLSAKTFAFPRSRVPLFAHPRSQTAPQPTLASPGMGQGDRLDLSNGDRVVAGLGRGQEQNLLLDVRRQHGQVGYLRDAGAADVPQAGQVGVVAHGAVADQLLEPDG